MFVCVYFLCLESKFSVLARSHFISCRFRNYFMSEDTTKYHAGYIPSENMMRTKKFGSKYDKRPPRMVSGIIQVRQLLNDPKAYDDEFKKRVFPKLKNLCHALNMARKHEFDLKEGDIYRRMLNCDVSLQKQPLGSRLKSIIKNGNSVENKTFEENLPERLQRKRKEPQGEKRKKTTGKRRGKSGKEKKKKKKKKSKSKWKLQPKSTKVDKSSSTLLDLSIESPSNLYVKFFTGNSDKFQSSPCLILFIIIIFILKVSH